MSAVTSAERAAPSRPLEDVLVIDSVVHGYSTDPDNWVESPYKERVAGMLAETLWRGHRAINPGGDERYLLDRDRFRNGHDPDLLAHALFAESDTDICIYHGVPLYGIFKDGGSPLWVGQEMRRRYPDRVALYGPVSPWQPDALEVVEQLIVEEGVVGIKMYPMDIVNGEIHDYRLDDPEIAFPILERIEQLGCKLVATHKALPQGQVPSEPFNPIDVAGAASAFPNLTFEIVHGGLAFMDETAWQVARFDNVIINLENAPAFLMVRAPLKFAHLLGTFMFHDGTDRILWSSGATARHPQPFLEMFWDFEIPERLQEDYGYPPLTEEVKRGILGGNHARLLGWDVDELRVKLSGDEFGMRKALAEPWSGTG